MLRVDPKVLAAGLLVALVVGFVVGYLIAGFV